MVRDNNLGPDCCGVLGRYPDRSGCSRGGGPGAKIQAIQLEAAVKECYRNNPDRMELLAYENFARIQDLLAR